MNRALLFAIAAFTLFGCSTNGVYEQQLVAWQETVKAKSTETTAKMLALSNVSANCGEDSACKTVAAATAAMAIVVTSVESTNNTTPMPTAPKNGWEVAANVALGLFDRALPHAAAVYMNKENNRTTRQQSTDQNTMLTNVVRAATSTATASVQSASQTLATMSQANATMLANVAPSIQAGGNVMMAGGAIDNDQSNTGGNRTQGNNNDLSTNGDNRTVGDNNNVGTDGQIGARTCVATGAPASATNSSTSTTGLQQFTPLVQGSTSTNNCGE
jgi:hypothetical protein